MGKQMQTQIRPAGSNADEWAVLLEEYDGSRGFVAVQIAEAIEEAERNACERAIARMGWAEIDAFHAELRRGQSIYEDAGGYFLRAIRRLFGLPARDVVVTYQEAARALLAKPETSPRAVLAALEGEGNG